MRLRLHRALKKYGYLLVFLIPATLPLAWLGQRHLGGTELWPWLSLGVMFGLVPLLDALIGADPAGPAPEEEAILRADGFYRWLPVLCLPLLAALLAWATVVFLRADWSWFGALGWMLSTGGVMGAIGITAAHELIHRTERWQRTAGGLLLTLVCYPSFKTEHVRGHHLHVGTPLDASSAALGQGLYGFLLRAVPLNVVAAWRLEARRLGREGKALWRGDLLWLSLLSGAWAGAAFWVGGVIGLGFFLAQSLTAIVTLETINYIEHYGLRRRRLDSGRYEPPAPRHSWNADYVITNWLLFQLQRHADHHLSPARPYQLLRHQPDSPQLPAGYAAMFLLALVPPLWRRVMDPRVAERS